MAVGVLNKCYIDDEKKTLELLQKTLTTWGQETTLTLAYYTQQMGFMSHHASQTIFNKIWRSSGGAGKFVTHTVITNL